jgi:hypothetical protein
MGLLYALLSMLVLNFNIASEIPYSSIEAAFASGDASKIVSYGKDAMLLNVENKEGAYSHSQAAQVLKEFFTRKPATAFKFTFRGKETDEGTFAIGNYQTRSEAYRVTIKWKKISGDFKIESITIEKN